MKSSIAKSLASASAIAATLRPAFADSGFDQLSGEFLQDSDQHGLVHPHGSDLELDQAWRVNVLAVVGDYGAVYERGLKDNSPFKLTRGVDAPWNAGGLIAPPVAE
jgi:hypothetical protein